MKKAITLEERKKIQLEMLIEIDAFCRAHNIKYMLAFGTLIGAIRHKGYIPWDDDVDISMPLEDMMRFKKEFKSERLKYCDVDTEKYYEYHFSRIANNATYSRNGICAKSYGVNIDLYPTIEVNASKEENQNIADRIYPTYNKRIQMIVLRRRLMKILPIPTIIGFEKQVRIYRDMSFQLFESKNGGRYHCIAGPLEKFETYTFDFNPFEQMIELDFEGHKFMGPAKYHEFLTKVYGDYMQLPPEDQRHPYHGGLYYWK